MTDHDAGTPRSQDDRTSPELTEDRDAADSRWIPGPSVLETSLPADVQRPLGTLLGQDPVPTLGDWVAQIRARTRGESIEIEQLCHTDGQTAHWGQLGDERHHFRCFYDAVILAALADAPVHIHTRSPGGEAIEAEAAGTAELSVQPAEAVFSFGVDTDVGPPADGSPSPAAVYAAVCPYVKAFPAFEAYQNWADQVPAATVAMPLSGGTDVAAALVD